jgi:hypothetical protein
MKRLLLILAIAAIVMGLAAPTVLAADPGAARSDRVLMAFNGDITVPAGERADAVIVTGGTATIQGRVDSLVVLDGKAVLEGASLQNVFVARGSVTIDAGTTVSGDVRTLDATVTQDPAATVGGTVGGVDADLVGFGVLIAPVIVLFMLGFALVTLVAGLTLAALAARQVRSAEALISHEPGQTLLVGLAGLVLVPILAVLAIVTVIGAPLGLAILLMVWPAAAIAGYLVAGIWIGDWLLARGEPDRKAERPYLAAVVGLIVLQVAGIVPFVAPIASLFGFGAVLLLAWRTFRQPGGARTVPTPPATQPIGA